MLKNILTRKKNRNTKFLHKFLIFSNNNNSVKNHHSEICFFIDLCMIFFTELFNIEAKRVIFVSMLNNLVKKNRTEVYKKNKLKVYSFESCKSVLCAIFN